MNKTTLTTLKTGAAPVVLGLALVSSAAFAQATNAQPAVDCTANPGSSECTEPANEAADDTIIVTGSILRRTDTETPSPVTTLSTENLEQRGINSISEGLQRVAANGSGTISEGWNNGSNFAQGANAVSLRGLTVQRTLTVFDGLRMAPYPVADDGHRNFVDLNTIIEPVVERTDVLKDGASSTYGADAVAGVINLITRKEVKGVHMNVSSGISEHGDGAEQRIDVRAGIGDLDEQGFNVYVAGSYRKNDPIYARDRRYPFNSGDLTGICNDAGQCLNSGTGGLAFGVNRNGTLGGSTQGLAPLVAAATQSATGSVTRLTDYRLLNNNCASFLSKPVVLPNSARGISASTGLATYAADQCTSDFRQTYATLRPETERYGFAARATVKIGEKAEAYISGNYQNTHTYTTLQSPAAFVDQTTAPQVFVLNPLVLPVYVCANGVGTIGTNGINVSSGCNATNGVLNPNNPFASAGQVALVRGRYDLPRTVETNARALRVAAGIEGAFGTDDAWGYKVDFTASEVTLKRTSENYFIPQRLADVAARGTYNFAQPWLNTQAVRDYVSPINVKESKSKLWQAQAVLSRNLFELPGGPLQAAVGVSYRHEAIDDESANPENLAHPYDRYYTINAVGAVGSRNVRSGFFELGAPIVDQLELNVSGRYDDYSSGQKNFSPKVGVKVKPVEQLVVRGTWSKGFRIPSFNESFGLPTTGYATQNINCTTYAAFCASHGNNTYVTNQYSLGRTSTGNPGLDPERSTSWTVGAVFEPIRGVAFTVDYFNIKIKDVIGNIGADEQTAALDAYLRTGNTTAVPGVVLVPGVADPQFPNALPIPAFLQFSFQNADQEEVQGIDFGVTVNRDLGGIRFRSELDASYLLKYQVTRKSGAVERYDGTLSPCDYTSCSGSPKWRASWFNAATMGAVTLNATVYYTGPYDLAEVDYGMVKGECATNGGVSYAGGGPVSCRTKAHWNVDLGAQVKINDRFTLYGNILNAFNIKPPFDPAAAYSITQYNPAWGQANIVGRYFRVGARVDF